MSSRTETGAAATPTRPPDWLAQILRDRRGDAPVRFDESGDCVSENGLVAPNRGGVLRFVPGDSYAESFGREWTWFDRTQLDRPERGETESRETFFQKTGWRPQELDGKLVLDVGCGMGRFAEVASAHGARVVGIDLSTAVDAAYANLGERSDVAVLQADVRRLPFRAEQFDLIYSLGVLHHTPDTRAAFLGLPPLLKPGGEVAIWVYARDHGPWRAWWVSDQLRRLTTRMDHDRLLRWCRRLEPMGRLYRTRYGKRLYRLLPVSTHAQREWRILGTFDWYAPEYQWKHDWDEVESWFAEAGLIDIRRNPFPVAVSGRRPL